MTFTTHNWTHHSQPLPVFGCAFAFWFCLCFNFNVLGHKLLLSIWEGCRLIRFPLFYGTLACCRIWRETRLIASSKTLSFGFSWLDLYWFFHTITFYECRIVEVYLKHRVWNYIQRSKTEVIFLVIYSLCHITYPTNKPLYIDCKRIIFAHLQNTVHN